MNKILRKVLVALLLLTLVWPITVHPASAADNQAALPGPRQLLRAVTMADGKVMALGGNDGLTHSSATMIYNPTTNSWTAGPSMQAARFSHAAALLHNGKILAIGGNNFTTGVSAQVEILDPTTNTWSNTGSLLTARAGHTATTLPDGRVLVVGGANDDDGDLSSTEIYDPATGTWSAGPSMPSTRKEHAAASLDDGRVLVTGGMVNNNMSNSALIYDPSLNSWSPAANMLSQRYVHASNSLEDGRVGINGGFTPSYTPETSTEIYDPEVDQWIVGPSMNNGRLGHDSVLLTNGNVFVVGGAGNSGPTTSSETYHPTPRAARPKISVAAGDIAPGTNVTLSTFTAGATIYYTTDGTTPTTASLVYSGPIAVNQAMTIKAIAHRNDWGSSRVLSASYTMSMPTTVAPVANPAGGAVLSGTNVTLTSGTVGAAVYYTTDGSTPTISSQFYNMPISITSPQTIKAIAVSSGMADSSVMTENYTILEQVAAPTANPAGAAVAAGTLVALTSVTSGAAIYYTTDGSTPTTSSQLYILPISITSAQTIKAIAVKVAMADSSVMTENYTLMDQVAAPTANPAGGAVLSGTNVALTSGTVGAAVYYTTDGSTPTTGSQLYSMPISITSAQTIKAIAVHAGMTDSVAMTETYTVMPQAEKPIANPVGRMVYSGQKVTLTTSTPEAEIHYTTDGSTPTASSQLYSTPIIITSARTIKAITVKSGMADSAMMSESYTIYSSETTGPAPQLPADPESEKTGADVLFNGQLERAGTVTNSQQNGRKVTTISIDAQKLEQRLAAVSNGAVITFPVSTAADVVAGELNGQMVKNMDVKQAVVEIRTDSAAYTLPAKQINIDAIAAQVGSNVALQDIKVQIEIAQPTANVVKVVQDAASNGGFKLVVPAMEFTVRATYGDKTVNVNQFNSYVERTLAIPDGVDPNRITTGVVVEPDGTVRHVPTKVIQIDGKYFAKINSLTNSTYSVIWHPFEFADADLHWAKDAVNEMGSRMVVNGFEDGTFKPDQDMTRAEFAAIVVRGLGLKLGKEKAPFSDVQSADWYNSAIQTASAYGLISGFEDGTFRPNDKITREQAVVIVAKAMKLSGLKDKLTGQQADSLLGQFADAEAVAEWAAGSVADAVQAGIISGRDGGELAPKALVTRAEVAVMVQNLLKKSGLI